MTAAVLLAVGAALSVLSFGLGGGRPARWLTAGLVVGLVAAAGFATALGSDLTGRPHAVIVLVGLVAAGIGGNRLTTVVFDLVDDQADDADHQDDEDQQPASLRSAGQVLRGGAWIGILERLAVYASLVAGWPEGIAVVLAIKGLGRYPELRAAHRSGLAERFIIGTLVSVLWAGLCVYAAAGPALG